MTVELAKVLIAQLEPQVAQDVLLKPELLNDFMSEINGKLNELENAVVEEAKQKLYIK